jgi:hypothetical protein
MRIALAVTTLLVLTASHVAAQDAFDARRVRETGASLGVSVLRGEWLPAYVWSEAVYDVEGYAVEAQFRRFGVRGAFADVRAGEGTAEALVLGGDVAIPLPRVPVSLMAGVEYQRARLAGGTLTTTSLPIYLMSDHALEFGRFWIYPMVALGTSVHRTGVAEHVTGARPYGRTGLEVGIGPVSVGARVQHLLKAPQTVEAGIRFRF